MAKDGVTRRESERVCVEIKKKGGFVIRDVSKEDVGQQERMKSGFFPLTFLKVFE